MVDSCEFSKPLSQCLALYQCPLADLGFGCDVRLAIGKSNGCRSGKGFQMRALMRTSKRFGKFEEARALLGMDLPQ